MRLGSRALVVVALLALACARKRPPAPQGPPPDVAPFLGPIEVLPLSAESPHPGELRLDVAALSAEVQAQLRGAGIFAAGIPPNAAASTPGAPTRTTARVRIEIGLEEVETPQKSAARAGTRLRIDTRPADVAQSHWHEDVTASSETIFENTPGVKRSAIFQKLVSRTVFDLLAAYVAKQKLWTGSPASVHAVAVADAGEEFRVEAIAAIGERRIMSEVPTLLALLTNDYETIRDAALGALVQMRERKAVTELARSRSMRDAREMRKILDAISVLGGQEAADYLDFVASGHEDEEIRNMAKQAQQRLKRRIETDKAPAPSP